MPNESPPLSPKAATLIGALRNTNGYRGIEIGHFDTDYLAAELALAAFVARLEARVVWATDGTGSVAVAREAIIEMGRESANAQYVDHPANEWRRQGEIDYATERADALIAAVRAETLAGVVDIVAAEIAGFASAADMLSGGEGVDLVSARADARKVLGLDAASPREIGQ